VVAHPLELPEIREPARRLRPLYATAFFQGFVFWYAIDKLFLRVIGLSDELIAIVTIVYIVVMMAASVPAGILADRWSRKGVLYIGTIALIASSIICGLSHGAWVYGAGICLWGVFYACYGVYDSLVYDTVLEETGTPEEFGRCFGRLQSFNSAAFIAGALGSGIAARYVGLRGDFFLSGPAVACALLTLQAFREPVLHKGSSVGWRTHVGETLEAAAGRRDVMWIMLCLVCGSVALRLLLEFGQLWYIAMRVPTSLYGPSWALLYIGVGVGGWLAHRLGIWRLSIRMIGLLTLAASAGLILQVPAAVILAQAAAAGGITALSVVMSRHLHDAMPSRLRAGVSSVVSAAGYGMFLPVALGFGVASQYRGVFVAAGFVVAATAGMLIALRVARSRMRPYEHERDEPAADLATLLARLAPSQGRAVAEPVPFPLFAAPVADDLEAPEFDVPAAPFAEGLEIAVDDQPGAAAGSGVAFVAHCLLNQNSKAGEGAYCAGISAPVVDALRDQGWRIEQLPCPELAFAGLARWWMVREQLDTVGYRRHCRRLADSIAARIAVHARQGRPVVLIGVDGSPSMGVHVTLSDPACGGPPVQPKANAALIPGEGILIEELRWALTLQGLQFPPAGTETHDLPGHDVAVQRIQLESLLQGSR
jgi:predicted secreted protein/MFS family permease